MKKILFAVLALALFTTESRGQDTEKKEDNSKTAQANETKPADGQKKSALKGGFRGKSAEPSETPSTSGQSLADIVKAAKPRPDAKKPAPVIDNRTVGSPAPTPKGKPGQPAAAPAPTPVKTAPSLGDGPLPSSRSTTDNEGRGEDYWRKRAQDARSRLIQAQDSLRVAEETTKKLETDFYSWDDGQYRDQVIKPAWDNAKIAEEKARQEASDAQKAIDGLEDEARKAGALPGWVRA
jgi:hypothetical protein